MAVLLTWALFILWTVIGLAVLKLGRHRWALPTLLLAPTVGFAALLAPIFILVRFGVPVRISAPPILLAMLALAAIVLWRSRPTAAIAGRLWRKSRIFPVILIAAFFLTAWPMIGYGLDWVANGNDDMACYCLAATGYRDHAFASVPKLEDLRDGRDSTQMMWFFYVLLQVRPSELSLSLASALTGLTAQQVFMPVIVALNLTLIAAASGLVGATAGRRGAIFTGALLATSAVMTYAVVQQVLGQVGGMALLCAALALVTGRFRHLHPRWLFRRACVCGLVFTSLLIFYPEIIPILVGGCVALGVRDIMKRRLERRYLTHAGTAIVVMAVLVPVYLYGAATFLATQSGGGGNSLAIQEIFPFYMTPRAAALVWGFLPLVSREPAAFQDACIITGFLLLACLIIPTVRNLMRRHAFAAAMSVIMVMTLVLFLHGAAFGLFKIAMFVQPFLWAVAGVWVAARRSRWSLGVAATCLVVLAALNARVQYWYVSQSRGVEYRVELPSAKRPLANARAMYAQQAATGPVNRVFLATENNVLLKLMAAELRDVPVDEVGIAPLSLFTKNGLAAYEATPWFRFHSEAEPSLQVMRDLYQVKDEEKRHSIRDPDNGQILHVSSRPLPDRRSEPPEKILVMTGGGSLSILNRHKFPENGPPIVCERLSSLRNFAVFCDATGARQYYLGLADPKSIALYQLEPDPAARKKTMAAVGQAMVLAVLNPTPRLRVLVNYTSTYRGDPANRTLPPIQVIGDRRVALGAAGSGSARLVSEPLATQSVNQGEFLALDFGNNATMNPNQLIAIEQLWGDHLPRDRRRMTGHARGISILTEEEYAAFQPPQALKQFPADLQNPQLEFSGFFEDGWINTAAKARLMQTDSNQECVISGHIPVPQGIENFSTEATVLIDGMPVIRRVLKTGDFELRVPSDVFGTKTGPRWIEMRFSQSQLLPEADGRRVSALIRSIGFEPKNEALSHPPRKISVFPAELNHPQLQQTGIFTDGWSEKGFRAQLWQDTPDRDVIVRGQIPDVAKDGAFRTEVTLLLDGKEVARRTLAPGDFEMRAPAGDRATGKTAQARWVECRFTVTQTLPPPDGRGVGAHLQFIGFEPPKAAP